MDPDPHRDPRAALCLRPRGALGYRAAGGGAGARARGRQGGRHRPPDRRHGDVGHVVPVHGGDPRRPAGRGRRSRVRPFGRLHRVHVRDHAGGGDACLGAEPAGARDRCGRPVEADELRRPLDVCPVRRRCGRGRARAGGGTGLSGVRAGRRRRGRRRSLDAGRRVAHARDGRDSRQRPSLCADERAACVQVRDAGAGQLRRGAAREDRSGDRGRGRLRSPPGQRQDHRSCRGETGDPGGTRRHERRSLWQHFVCFDPACARGCGRRRAGQAGIDWC